LNLRQVFESRPLRNRLDPPPEGPMAGSRKKRQEWSWWYLLLLVQFIAVLWPPFYNRVEPALIGLPFFYWYQLAWVVIGAVLTAIVHFATDE
jgi:hypothetical protein